MSSQTTHAFARTDRSHLGVWWWTTDRWLLGATAILMTVGMLLSFASSPAAAQRIGLDDQFHFALRQCVFGAAAAVIALTTSMLSPRGIRRSAFFIYIAAIAVMAALPFIGHSAKGAARWLLIGGFTFQPSEFMKPALIVLVAWMFSEGQKGEGVPGVSIAFGLYGIAERAQPINAYFRRILDADATVHGPAARSWGQTESILSENKPNRARLDLPALTSSRALPATPFMEAHYFSNGCFMQPDQLMREAGKLAGIPGIIVQGRYDLLCPPATSHALGAAWREAEIRIVEGAGHTLYDPGVRDAVMKAIADMASRTSK